MEPLPYHSPGSSPAQAADEQHLRLLEIFHYVWGGLIALISCVGLIHFTLGMTMIVNPAAFSGSQPPPPPFMGWLFAAIGGGIVLFGWTIGGLNIWSARCIRGRRSQLLSLVVAGFNCMSFPIGTALGVFTFVVLLRASVKSLYART